MTTFTSTINANQLYESMVAAAQPQPWPVPPMPSGAFLGNPAEDYFEPGSNAYELFSEHRRMKIRTNKLANVIPNWTLEAEKTLLDTISNHCYGHPYLETSSLPDLDVDALPTVKRGRRALAVFKLPYNRLDEIKLRLNKTVIGIKGNPFYVVNVKAKSDDFLLTVKDAEAKLHTVLYKDIPCLRTMPAAYVTVQGTVGWMRRSPERVYQQGMTKQNTTVIDLSEARSCATFGEHMVPVIAMRNDRQWASALEGLVKDGTVRSLRMTDDIAVSGKSGQVRAHFRGRMLGAVIEDTVKVFDEDDIEMPWVTEAAKAAGFSLRV